MSWENKDVVQWLSFAFVYYFFFLPKCLYFSKRSFWFLFLIMFGTTRWENKMDSCQIYNHIHIDLYEIIISDDLQSLELKSLHKKKEIALHAWSTLLFVFLFISFSSFFSYFSSSSFFFLVGISYHQALYFEDWFQIASGFTNLFRSFSAWLKSINKICQLELKEINLLNMFDYQLLISLSIMIK